MSMELLQQCQVNIPLNQVFGDKMSEKIDALRLYLNVFPTEDFHTFC